MSRTLATALLAWVAFALVFLASPLLAQEPEPVSTDPGAEAGAALVSTAPGTEAEAELVSVTVLEAELRPMTKD